MPGGVNIYCAVAETEFGRIPGKACAKGINMWYSVNGLEYHITIGGATKFYYV